MDTPLIPDGAPGRAGEATGEGDAADEADAEGEADPEAEEEADPDIDPDPEVDPDPEADPDPEVDPDPALPSCSSMAQCIDCIRPETGGECYPFACDGLASGTICLGGWDDTDDDCEIDEDRAVGCDDHNGDQICRCGIPYGADLT